MANLSLTLACNQDCEYCFARGLSGPARKPAFMSRETFCAALDFLERSGINEARLLGGEPTLHPQALDLIDLALGREFRVLLFSNGLMPETTARRLRDLDEDTFSVLINVTPSGSAEDKLREDTVAALGPRAMLGVNIWRPGQPIDFMLEWVDRHTLKRAIRLGLAQPSLSGGNRFLHPKDYSLVGADLAQFCEKASERGIAIDLDCGFVPCMFPAWIEGRFPQIVKQTGRRCNPIPDLLPDGRFVSCFPLADLGGPRLENTAAADDTRSLFARRLAPFQGFGIYPHCASCGRFRERSCLGGCRSAALARLRPKGATAATGAICGSWTPSQRQRSSSRIWALPYIDQPLEFWDELRADFEERVAEVYFPLPGRLVGSGRPPQPDANLDAFLRRSKLPTGVLVNPIVLPKPVESLAEPIIEALKRLRGEYGVSAVTLCNLTLATRIREALPELTITASTLMDVSTPAQATLLDGICDRLVPASRIMRDLEALRNLRAAFRGRVRLIVNEGCLPGCPLRTQHFTEMASFENQAPESLCEELLERRPWLRLTTSWVLPQHLRLYDGVYDELKLAGRVTLRDPRRYRSVVTSYVYGLPLGPHEIGAGPASVTRPMEIDDEFFGKTLGCEKRCDACSICEQYWESHE